MPINPQWLINVAEDMNKVFDQFMENDEKLLAEEPDNHCLASYCDGRRVMAGHMGAIMDYLIMESKKELELDRKEDLALFDAAVAANKTKFGIN